MKFEYSDHKRLLNYRQKEILEEKAIVEIAYFDDRSQVQW